MLIAAGFAAGAMNAMAGGGSFISFPALVFAGLPSVVANASSTVALFPGAVSSAWVYRRDFADVGGIPLWQLFVISVTGGLLGAILLLVTPISTFDAVVPWLLLFATLAFAFGRGLGARLRQHVRIGSAVMLPIQFILGLYGGYFGGAVGIMMLATWTLLGTDSLSRLNPARILMTGATNAIAVLCFIVAGKVWWPETLAMLVGAIAGGYGGASLARWLPPAVSRAIILVVTVGMTLVFFWRRYGYDHIVMARF